jgi:HTH-type transcriptional regulator / antitoxin HipB
MDTITLGKIIRARRKEKKITLTELSAHCNVGVRFLSELENGKPTIELGKALKVMSRLNIELSIIPTSEVQHVKYNTVTVQP